MPKSGRTVFPRAATAPRLSQHDFCSQAAMLGPVLKYFVLVAIAATSLSSCSYMTQSGRQQMAYQRYVRKMSGRQTKIKKKIKAPKMPRTPDLSPNKTNTEVIGTPQSVRSGESQTEAPTSNPSP